MNFARVYVLRFHMLVQFVCVRVCVLPSEMECVLFYSRKIAHQANVICCIMYPTLNEFNLILSYVFKVNAIDSLFQTISNMYIYNRFRSMI